MDYKWEAGQKVFSPSTGWSDSPGAVVTIERVTPSGRAVIGGASYDKSGRMVGGGKWCVGRIEPVTEDHYLRIKQWNKKYKVMQLFGRVKARNLTDKQVDILLPILESIVDEQK